MTAESEVPMYLSAEIFLIATLCISLGVGFFLCLKPEQAIRFQQRFYEKINWRMEPISLTKEIRNTRAMGYFLLACVLAAAVFRGVKIYSVYCK